MKLSEWLSGERGRGASLATSMGISPVLISQWVSGPRVVPVDRCVSIERFTGGVVTCEELRPDKAQDFAYLRAGADADTIGTELATAPPIEPAAAGGA